MRHIPYRPDTNTHTHLNFQLWQLARKLLHRVLLNLCAGEVNIFQAFAPLRERPDSRVAGLRVPELDPLQVLAFMSERLNSDVGHMCAAAQINVDQVGARFRQLFHTDVRDLRVGELDLGEKDAARERYRTGVGEFLVVAVVSPRVLVILCPLDRFLVIRGLFVNLEFLLFDFRLRGGNVRV